MTRTLTEADSKSIWGRLHQNKMDKTSSFFGMKDGLEHILNEPKVAFLNSGDFIRYFSDYHCKVCMIIVQSDIYHTVFYDYEFHAQVQKCHFAIRIEKFFQFGFL